MFLGQNRKKFYEVNVTNQDYEEGRLSGSLRLSFYVQCFFLKHIKETKGMKI